MKKLNILQSLFGIVFFFLIIELLKSIIFIFRIFFNYNVKLPVSINGIEITVIDGYTKIAFGVLFAGLLFFISSIYFLRKIVSRFIKNDLFNSEVILYFDKAGKFLFVSSLLKLLSFIIFFSTNKIQLNQNLKLDTHFPLLCLALFFMVLSETFKVAKKNKEENDLTI